MTNFGENLTLLRQSRGISRVNFAKELGCSRQYVFQLERGMKQPSELIFDAICCFFEVKRRFFNKKINIIPEEDFMFNMNKRSLSERCKLQVIAMVNLLEKNTTTSDGFSWLEKPLGLEGCEDIFDVGEAVRAKLGCGIKPIKNIRDIVRKSGIEIIEGSQATRIAGTFSVLCRNPMIFVDDKKEDHRFHQNVDIAMAFGSLIIVGQDLADEDTESSWCRFGNISNLFALGFLIPRYSGFIEVVKNCIKPGKHTRINFADLVLLSIRWRVPITFLVKRVNLSNCMNWRQLDNFCAKAIKYEEDIFGAWPCCKKETISDNVVYLR